MSKHIDGLTGEVFETEAEYLAHVSPVTGYKPTDIEHHGLRGLRVAEKALERTGSLKGAVKTDVEAKLTKVRDEEVETKVRDVVKAKGQASKLVK